MLQCEVLTSIGIAWGHIRTLETATAAKKADEVAAKGLLLMVFMVFTKGGRINPTKVKPRTSGQVSTFMLGASYTARNRHLYVAITLKETTPKMQYIEDWVVMTICYQRKLMRL